MQNRNIWLYGVIGFLAFVMGGATCGTNQDDRDGVVRDGGLMDTDDRTRDVSDDDGSIEDTNSDSSLADASRDVGDGGADNDGRTDTASECTNRFDAEWEPNETRENAHDLEVFSGRAQYKEMKAVTACPGDTDWYSLEESLENWREQVRKGDRLEVALHWVPTGSNNSTVPANLNVELLHEDPDGSVEVVETAEVNPDEKVGSSYWWTLSQSILQGRNLKYYVRVTGDESRHRYDFAVVRRRGGGPQVPCQSDTFEPNDTDSEVTAHHSGAPGEELRLCPGDIDIHSWKIDDGETRKIVARYAPTVDLEMTVDADSPEVSITEPPGNVSTDPKDVVEVQTPPESDASQDEYRIRVRVEGVSHTSYVGRYMLYDEPR